MVFVLDQKNPFWTNLVKKSKLSVKAEMWYQETKLNRRNSVMMLTCSVFDQKYLFVQISSKKKNCQFELKFRTRLI